MKAAIYLRVSTDDQDVRNQEPDVLRFCEEKKLQIVKRYTEVQSGRSAKWRHEYQQLLKDAVAKRFDIVVVWKLDRFGRRAKKVLSDVLDLESNVGVRVWSATQNFMNVDGPWRMMLVAALAAVAELEFDNLGERTKAGLERARKEGVRIGRPRLTSPELHAALEKVKSGVTPGQAARLLGVSDATLRRALKRGETR